MMKLGVYLSACSPDIPISDGYTYVLCARMECRMDIAELGFPLSLMYLMYGPLEASKTNERKKQY
jgi:hypothetical protein